MSVTIIFLASCFASIILTFVPLAWHIKNKNTSAICLIVWITLFNIISFINASIWGGENFQNSWNGAGFCDVEIKLIIAASAGMMAATAAISRNLAKIMSDNISVVKTKSVRRRELAEDLLICFGIPVWMMSAHYIVQPNRYYIIGIIGCQPSVDNSWPTIVLLYIWPPIIAIMAAYYSGLVLFRVHKYRQQFSEIIRNSGSNITRSRFLRLFVISIFLVSINVPVVFYVFYRNLNNPLIPYSWKLVHTLGWNYIPFIPSHSIQFDRWIPVVAGFVCFAFFGTGNDAAKMYREWLGVLGVERYISDSFMGRITPKNNQWSANQSNTFSRSWASGKRLLSSTSSRFTSSNTEDATMSPENRFDHREISLVASPNPVRVGSIAYFGTEHRYNEEGIRVERAVDIVIEDKNNAHT